MSDSDIQLQSILFGPDAVEISFIERGDVTEAGITIRTIRTHPMTVADECADLIDAAEAFIAAYQLRVRNPPVRIPSRRDQ